MGFFGNLVGAIVKTALTPIAIVKDVVEVTVGGEADNTSNLVENIVEDISQSIEDLSDGDF